VSEGKVYTSQLTWRAKFTLNFVVATAETTQERVKAGDITAKEYVIDFLARFQTLYKVPFKDAPRERYLKDVIAGTQELADLGLVDVNKDAEGTWVVTRIRWDRLDGGNIFLPN
jgi:hypothetical protein